MEEVALRYIRKSSPWQKDENQKDDVTSKSYRWGFLNPLMFMDTIKKYVQPEDRDEMPKVIEHLLKGGCILFVRTLDRIGGTKIIIRFVDQYIRKLGNRLVTIEDGEIDLKDWDAFVKLVHSKRYEEIDRERADKTKKGKLKEAERCKVISYALEREMGLHRSLVINRPNFGVVWDKDKDMFVATEDKHWVSEVFDMYLFDDMGSDKIARHLNENGIRTAMGSEFSANAVLKTLKNWAYLTGVKKDRYGQEYKYEEILMDEYRFMRAKDKMWQLSSKGGKLSGMMGSIFGGILWCGICSCRMHKSRDRYRCGRCGNKVSENYLLEKVKSKIMKEVNEKLYGGRYDVFFHADTIKRRLFDINAIDWKRLIRNWIPIELDKRILVMSDRIVIRGLTASDLDMLLGIECESECKVNVG